MTITVTAIPSDYLSSPQAQPGSQAGDVRVGVPIVTSYPIIPGSVRLTLGYAADNYVGAIGGAELTGICDYASQRLLIFPASLPAKGTTLRLGYRRSTVDRLSLAYTPDELPARDPATQRATIDLGTPIFPGSLELYADLTPVKRNRFMIGPDGATVPYWVVDRALKTRDEARGNLISRWPNFGNIRYGEGLLDLDTRFFTDPVVYFGLEYETRIYRDAETYFWTPQLRLLAIPSGPTIPVTETIAVTSLVADLSRLDTDSTLNTLSFMIGSSRFYGRDSLLYRDFSHTTGAATVAGSIDLATNQVTITDW